MLNKNTLSLVNICMISLIIFACSSQEYTTAKLAIQQSDFSKAEEWLPKAMAVEPDNPEIPMMMGVEIYAKDQKWKEMMEMFDRAISIDPEKVIELRGAYLSVKEAVDNYTEFYWAKEFNVGVEQFKKIQNDPDNKIEYLDKAIMHFKNAVLINPLDANSYTTLAKCYFDKGNKEAAKDAVLEAVNKNPESFDANFSAGQILARAGESSEVSLKYYDKAVNIEPSNSKALRELASIYYDLGKSEESIKVFENAIINEDEKIVKADLYFNLGVIYSEMNNFEKAEESFDEAFFLNEEDVEAVLGMAAAYEGVGDNYFNGVEGYDKDLNQASRWYRKAEKKIKDVMIIDLDNKDKYQKNLDLVRYKRDIAEGN